MPNADNEGSLGRSTLRWGDVQTLKLNGATIPLSIETGDANKVLSVNESNDGYILRDITDLNINTILYTNSITLAQLNNALSDANLTENPTIDFATAESAGIVKVGSGLSIELDGTLSAQEVSIATAESAGIVKVGNSLSINNGVLDINQRNNIEMMLLLG